MGGGPSGVRPSGVRLHSSKDSALSVGVRADLSGGGSVYFGDSLARVSPNPYSEGMTKQSKSRNQAAAVIYCRVSALDSQAANGADTSLEAQERTLRAAAEAAGYSEVIVVVERHTASKRQPELEAALELLGRGEAVALFAAKIDRLSRKGAADVLRVADRAEAQGWRLVILDVSLDTGTTVGRLVLTILAGVAEMESRRRSERMREYHAERRARGDRPYGPQTTASREAVETIAASRAAGMSWKATAEVLTSKGVDSRRWHPTAVRRVAASPSAAAILAA